MWQLLGCGSQVSHFRTLLAGQVAMKSGGQLSRCWNLHGSCLLWLRMYRLRCG